MNVFRLVVDRGGEKAVSLSKRKREITYYTEGVGAYTKVLENGSDCSVLKESHTARV